MEYCAMCRAVVMCAWKKQTCSPSGLWGLLGVCCCVSVCVVVSLLVPHLLYGEHVHRSAIMLLPSPSTANPPHLHSTATNPTPM